MMIGKGMIQIEILKTLADTGKPLSCREITKILNKKGINVSERTVRKYVTNLMRKDCIKMGSSKATITEQGMETLKRATVFERLGEFRDLVEYNMFNSTFSLYTLDGTVPTNLAIVDKDKIDKCLELMKTIADANLTTSRLIMVVDEEETLDIIEVPKGKMAIGAISSTIYNVIMLNIGIVLGSEFAGLLKYENSKPVGFTEMINYSGTTISPGLLFIRGGYTSLYEVARTGNGYVVTAVKSFSEYAYEFVEREVMLANARGITGVLTISSPMDNKLNLPVYKKALLIVLAGVNSLAPLYEKGLNPELKINEILLDFKEFKDIDRLI